MRLSLRALKLCRAKLGKGSFHGFQEADAPILDEISEESARQDFEEMTQSGVVELSDGNVRISPLGQHIFHMLLDPDQYIMIDYEESSVRVRVYIRDVYYLCVLEDKTVQSEDGYGRFIFRLVPLLEHVIGSFAYAFQREETALEPSEDADPAFQITGKAWNRGREVISELAIHGCCREEHISCRETETAEGAREFKCEQYELINRLTKWMLENLSVIVESEVH